MDKKERRIGNVDIIEKLAIVATEVRGISKRLDKINGSIDKVNEEFPQYKEKVDGLENDMVEIKPQVIGIRVKLYAGMGIISFCSAMLGAAIMKYLGA